jgi:hypothetical protein
MNKLKLLQTIVLLTLTLAIVPAQAGDMHNGCVAVAKYTLKKMEGKACGWAAAQFDAECSVAMDGEAPEVGIAVCNGSAAAIKKVCVGEITASNINAVIVPKICSPVKHK